LRISTSRPSIEEDEFISRAAQAQIKAALAGKPSATVCSYPGQHHAFARHNGAHYDAAAAALANGPQPNFSIATWGDVRSRQAVSRKRDRSHGRRTLVGKEAPMIVKTELESVEENDGSIRKAIERRAHELYELDGFKDGSDQYHWFRAEKELTIQDPMCSIEDDKVTVRLPMEGFSAATVLVSISARRALILNLEDKSRPGDSDLLRVVSLPVAVDATRVTCELDGATLYNASRRDGCPDVRENGMRLIY
jgi:hypothetical protein